MLYYVPLEILDERYTASMDSLLRREFQRVGLKYTVTEGQVLSEKIEDGAFLDFAGTNYFKASQLQNIASLFFHKKVQNGDVFFFSDLWFPGIDMIPYMSQLSGIDTKVVGILHAGSWTPTDFVSLHLRDYCQFIEVGWFSFFDEVYVGSSHHKDEIITGLYETLFDDMPSEIGNSIQITGLPFDYNYVKQFCTEEPKRRQVVYPHRFHWEKGADTFLKMVEHVAAQDDTVQFVITSGRSGDTPLADQQEILSKYVELKGRLGPRLTYKSGLSKPEFYSVLNESAVVWSSAHQENFGYSILEACTLGVTPVLVNRASYCEFYPQEYRYTHLDDGFDMVLERLNCPKPLEPEYTRQFDGTSRIVKHVASWCQ